jgi:hypothetical protein
MGEQVINKTKAATRAHRSFKFGELVLGYTTLHLSHQYQNLNTTKPIRVYKEGISKEVETCQSLFTVLALVSIGSPLE